MKSPGIRRATFVSRRLIFILLPLCLCLEISWPASQIPVPSSSASALRDTTEETVTLPASKLMDSQHGDQWFEGPTAYCGPPFHIWPPYGDHPGTVFVGYAHYYDKGKVAFPCPDGAYVALRGGVWFDLSSIVSKAPPLHVSVESALLHFRKDRECAGGELLIAKENWLSDSRYQHTLIPGDPFQKIPACAPRAGGDGSPECVSDVTTVVNNWVRGEDHGGYANYGFVFKGEREAEIHWKDNDVCQTFYSDITLTVKYKYDKPAGLLYVPLPRTNYALASNGGKASASSTTPPYLPSFAIDGERAGVAPAVWADSTLGVFPDWIEIDFAGQKTIDEIDVITRQDNLETPMEPEVDKTTFTKYGITAYDVQYWDGSSWVTVPGGNVGRGKFGPAPNNKVWRRIKFPKVTTGKIRIQVNSGIDNALSRIVEVEAWGN